MQGRNDLTDGVALALVLVERAVRAPADDTRMAEIVELDRMAVGGELDVLLGEVGGGHAEVVDRRSRSVPIVQRCRDRVVDMAVAQGRRLDGLDEVSDEEVAQVYEVADLWFHTLVLLAHQNLRPEAVLSELQRRFALSGIAEKALRDQGSGSSDD